MIFGRIPDEQRQANAEHAAETVLYRENVELREQTRDLEKQLSIVESFSDAEAELFGLFNAKFSNYRFKIKAFCRAFRWSKTKSFDCKSIGK